jgi:hypothetical protein
MKRPWTRSASSKWLKQSAARWDHLHTTGMYERHNRFVWSDQSLILTHFMQLAARLQVYNRNLWVFLRQATGYMYDAGGRGLQSPFFLFYYFAWVSCGTAHTVSRCFRSSYKSLASPPLSHILGTGIPFLPDGCCSLCTLHILFNLVNWRSWDFTLLASALSSSPITFSTAVCGFRYYGYAIDFRLIQS